ncbi:hypothetical protein VP01_6547g1 [Puccinia sorghi]|uniref:Uncharacterized protein n=1 Tax=Puccinia sorghi TaxID=27349 RepID=A0A0L6UFD4_9BASI|nr:hypothetical protein VP01_6547g1 [Puccinia sorghi]
MPKKATPKHTKTTTKKPAIQRKSKKNRSKNSSEDDGADKTAAALELGSLLLLVVQPKYKNVHTKYISMGFVLTNEYQKGGISTIHEILESMYPHYHVMNKLIGVKRLSTLGSSLMHKLTTKQHHPLLSLLEMKLEAVTWKATIMIVTREKATKKKFNLQGKQINKAGLQT